MREMMIINNFILTKYTKIEIMIITFIFFFFLFFFFYRIPPLTGIALFKEGAHTRGKKTHKDRPNAHPSGGHRRKL